MFKNLTAKQFLNSSGTCMNYLYDGFYLRSKDGFFLSTFQYVAEKEAYALTFCDRPDMALVFRRPRAEKMAAALTRHGYNLEAQPVKAWFHADFDGSLN